VVLNSRFGLSEWGRAMSQRNNLSGVLYKVDLLIAEIKALRTAGPHFRIVHRFRMPETYCLPGEEIAAVYLIHRGREYHLRLSLALRILFNFLACHSRLPHSARQIEMGIRADDFYRQHGANATGRATATRGISRSIVRVYVKRLHRALALAFQEAKINLDPRQVVVSRATVGNEVSISLKASCDWLHIDISSRNRQPSR